MSQEFVQLQEELAAERKRSSELEQNLNILSNKHSREVEEYRDEISALEELRYLLICLLEYADIYLRLHVSHHEII